MNISVNGRKKQNKKSFEELIKELTTSNSEKIRYNAARVLGEMGDSGAVDPLIDVLKKLNIKASQLLRTSEDIYKELNLKDKNDEEKIIEAMVQNPILIERPIIIKGQKAVIARPIENLSELLK